MPRYFTFLPILAAASSCVAAPVSAPASDPSAALAAAVAAPTRSPDNVKRDAFRHPLQTLTFFGVRPSDTVVEIWSGGGWYTEILAPYLASGGGRLIAANLGGDAGSVAKLKAAHPTVYGGVTVAEFPVFDGRAAAVPDSSADVVLTFRNVHNWRMGYRRDDKVDYSAAAFRQIYAMLKPGGVLGIVDHRLPETADAERERKSGYMKPSTIIALARQAGFTLAGSSEINANPNDTADWPDGVWTLPPTFALKDTDRAKYAAIGESDRMTLKFVKPR